jgi:hypothetical protein
MNINNYKTKNIMKKRFLLIAIIGISFSVNAQNETVNGILTVNGPSSNKALKVNSDYESPSFRDQVLIYSNTNNGFGIAFAGNGHHRGGIYADNSGGNTGSGNITIWTRNQGNIFLNAENVGIGTVNTNGWKLAVNGKIRAKEIKVETGWSDFVFESNYSLPTLIEVEKHIKEKGHLKDIPSAKEVAKNGIFLGEMDSKLLQKIEELTLYTIQQQKEIENLKNENESLKSLVAKFLELQKRLEKLEKK